MKTGILLFVLVCAFVVPVTGSSQDELTNRLKHQHPFIELSKKLNLVFQDHNTSKRKANEIYDLTSVEQQIVSDDDFISFYKTDLIYQSGNLTERIHSYLWDYEDSWEIESRELRTYQNNRLAIITQQIMTNQEYVNSERTLITYQQSEGQIYIHGIIEQVWSDDDSVWENQERTMLSAENGVITGGESGMWDGTQWIVYERFMMEEQGDDLYTTYQEHTGSEWYNTERQVFYNYTIADLYNLFSEEMTIIDTGAFLAYVQLFPDFTGQYWTGTDWMDEERQLTVAEYNWQTGEMISKQISSQTYDEEWITQSEIRISYENGFPKEMVLYQDDDYETGELLPAYAEELEYNNLDLVQYILQKQVPEENYKSSDSHELEITGRLLLHWSGTATSVEDAIKPVTFSLGNAYPNPFNPSTVIPFEVGNASHITIKVYDMLGRYVTTLASDVYSSGSHSVRFDGSGLASGVYLVRLDAPGLQQTRRITLLK